MDSCGRSTADLPGAFLGGTALRFLYSIARFSEALDFSQVLAASQTGWPGSVPTADTLRRILAEKLAAVNWRASG